MTTFNSAISSQRLNWQTLVIFTLAFWISSTLLLDLVIMPSMYFTGMMRESGFATAGYSIFWLFNRLELCCAALALSGIMALRHSIATVSLGGRWALPLAMSLLAIALLYTYGFTPEMSALGLQLNWFEAAAEPPALMNQMHSAYWLLELCKLAASGLLLRYCYQALRRSTAA